MSTASNRITHGTLAVAPELDQLVRDRLVPGLTLTAEKFWATLAEVVAEFGPKNQALLDRRDALQTQLDGWYRDHPAGSYSPEQHREFLQSIGYLVPTTPPFQVTVKGVDREIAGVAGPQLVVPVSNARYALNAANARWGSLYDALYGTNVIPAEAGQPQASGYDRNRGAQVVAWAREFLDRAIPLAAGSHRAAIAYTVAGGDLLVRLQGGATTGLQPGAELAGWRGEPTAPSAVLIQHHGLHLELQFDRQQAVGRDDPAGINDVILESAITTIQDFEDSVAAVDAADKALVYSNWLGLMRGELSETFQKGGRTITRRLNPDRRYQTTSGTELALSGRSLLLARNVGLHMYTDAVVDSHGRPIPEGMLDAVFTCACSLHDLARPAASRNSAAGNIYVVKPKMHGPEEVALACAIFARVEAAFGLAPCTVKIGIMDEERRTTVNLAACIAAARDRVIFINTGFLDRTGDEIHTSMEAGPMVRKSAMKQQPWIAAYEDWNVDVGLACGLRGHGQIGKGMWAAPDQMAQMVKTKIAHPQAGASTAWVPSPTAATLHATHYHEVDVSARQAAIAQRAPAQLDAILTVPLLGATALTPEEIQRELDNNIQSLLGYVVRWVDQGVGCSKVPDIDDVALMEDRATLRISSQHLANWLRHGLCTRDQVQATLERMAGVVDRQNAGDPAYRPMLPHLAGNLSFQAASDLIFLGAQQPNGYTEFILHDRRRAAKAAHSGAQG